MQRGSIEQARLIENVAHRQKQYVSIVTQTPIERFPASPFSKSELALMCESSPILQATCKLELIEPKAEGEVLGDTQACLESHPTQCGVYAPERHGIPQRRSARIGDISSEQSYSRKPSFLYMGGAVLCSPGITGGCRCLEIVFEGVGISHISCTGVLNVDQYQCQPQYII